MPRILLADDHAVVRKGLRALLADEPAVEVVGEATTADEAQVLAADLQPDVMLLDLRMPGPPATETVRFLGAQSPETRVIVLTAHGDEAAVRELVGLGVRGYVLKDDPPDTLVEAIQAVERGGTWFSPQVVAALLERRPAGEQEHGMQLTERERDLLELVKRGWDNQRIAAELSLGEQTIRNYLHVLYSKLGVSSRAEAVVWAHQHDLPADR